MDKQKYYMDICKRVAERGTCTRMKVGAIIVKDGVIISTGYNGAPSGMKHCNEVGCLVIDNHCVRTVHAEVNCIINAARIGINITGSEIWCTSKPCYNCMKVIINSGIKKVYYFEEYRGEFQEYFEKELEIIKCAV